MKDVIEGRIKGRRGPGRVKQSMLHELMEGKEGAYEQMKRKARIVSCGGNGYQGPAFGQSSNNDDEH